MPISDDGRRVVALVAVGIRKSAVGEQVRAQLPGILLAGLVAALLSGLGTALVARRIRRQTHGLGEQQLREMYEYYDAVLHAVTEGLLITDLDGRLRLANDEAIRLLGLPADAVGRPVAELGLADAARRRAHRRRRRTRTSCTSRRPGCSCSTRARPVARVGCSATSTTLRDRTDLEALTGELDSARGLTEALRSQAHESANRLHTIVSLIELGHTDRALDFATEELQVSQVLTDRVVGSVEEPALTALLLGKAAEAHERGIDLRHRAGRALARGRRADPRRRDHRRQPHRQRPRRRGRADDRAPGDLRRRRGRHVAASTALVDAARMPSSTSPTPGRVCRRARSTTPSGAGGRRRSRAARAAGASGWPSWRRPSTGSAGRSRSSGPPGATVHGAAAGRVARPMT